MRIIAGAFRGRRLSALGQGDAVGRLRPTPDRVREALFSMIEARLSVEGASVLDLFAGTGALGLEALSRGAAHATFIDKGRPAQKLIAANIALLGVGGAARLLPVDATRLPPAAPGAACSLVFLDPPYGRGLGEKALASAAAQGWIAPGALIAWEESAPQAPPPAPPGAALGFTSLAERRYGSACITLLEATSP